MAAAKRKFSVTAVLGILCITLSAATGCKKQQPPPAKVAAVPPQPQVKPAPPTPIAEKKAELDEQTWNPQWDAVVEKALPTDLLGPQAARAVHSYCPRFSRLDATDKRAFWAYVFQALAGAEAGLKPTTDVKHTEPEVAVPDAVTHRTVHQEGLLQLTYEDQKRYGCDFDWERDRKLPVKDSARSILDPRKNLLCGVRIMENQIIAQGKPLLSRTSYWATLQPGTLSFRVFAKQMVNEPKDCRVTARPATSRPHTPHESRAAGATAIPKGAAKGSQ